jgi:signal transduction histidine kinase
LSFLDGALLIAGYQLLRHYIHQRDRAEVQMMLAKEAAEKANRAKDEFLAMVSHDLRSPLNAIGLWLILLRRGGLSPAQLVEAIDSIEHSLKSQTRLVTDLLDVSRMVHGKFHVDRKPMDLIPLLSAAVANVRAAAESKDVSLEFESSVKSIWIMGDAARLQQVAWNLLSNAVKFTPPGGRVALRVREVPDAVEFQVADSGMGIPADFLPRMFDRFSQSETTGETRKKGLGLGLSIVKHIVELHDGSATAQSAGEGQGATFTVRLPALHDAAVRNGSGIPRADVTRAPIPAVAK